MIPCVRDIGRPQNRTLGSCIIVTELIPITIKFILCSSEPKGGYDPPDIELVNFLTPSVYIVICTKQTIK